MADKLCFSSTCNFKNNSCFFFYDLSLLCSFIFSHPLYFSYFLFFSPYLFKFIFFISPLFFTTTLVLLLSLLTTTLPQPKLGFIQTILNKLRSKLNDVEDEEEFCNFEEFEIYKIVFHDPPLITVGDGDSNEEVSVMENAVAVAVAVTVTIPEGDKPEVERSLESLFEELDRFEDSTAAIETTEKESRDIEKVVGEVQKTEPLVKKKLGSKSMAVVEADEKPFEKSSSVKSDSWRVDSSSSFGSYGSMRKEKEWKRTLACKLFEERHNSEGGEEGMDSLWEAYEDDNSSRKSKNRKEAMVNQKKNTMMKNKKIEFKYDFEEDDDDDDEEEFMSNGQLCCLKALKLSAGKMNLGMGKPNLVKISKALKGFGWLHHVGSKHVKKN